MIKIKNEMVTILIHFIEHHFSVSHEMKEEKIWFSLIDLLWALLPLLMFHEVLPSTDFYNVQG